MDLWAISAPFLDLAFGVLGAAAYAFVFRIGAAFFGAAGIRCRVALEAFGDTILANFGDPDFRTTPGSVDFLPLVEILDPRAMSSFISRQASPDRKDIILLCSGSTRW